MLYFEGARIITESDKKNSTVKSMCLNSRYKNKKQLFALVCETLKYRTVINEVIEKTKFLKQERSITSDTLGQVLIYDLLFGKGVDSAPKKLKEAIQKHKSALSSELARIKIRLKATKNEDLLSEDVIKEGALPRYVRVNLLKSTVEDVIQHFKTEGFTLVISRGLDYGRYIQRIRNLQPREFAVDIHLPELLVFAPKTDLHAHVLYTRGDIILQDKASCIPAHVLAPPRDSHVIDCCAAPGNKTSHAAAYMSNKGKIFAFDLDARRLATMGTLTLKAGVLCAHLTHQNFLKVDATDPLYANVRYAIVDPSCSGSGIVSRLNSVTDDKESSSSARIEKLSSFQQSILSHALSFPAMERVVYSTCSIHSQENETVVEKVLNKFKNKFQLEKVLPTLPSRGDSSFSVGDKCAKFLPEKDCTNGFFVACFTRIDGEHEDDEVLIQQNVVTNCNITAPVHEEENECTDNIAENENCTDVKLDIVEVKPSKSSKKRKRKKGKGISKEDEKVGKMVEVKCENPVEGDVSQAKFPRTDFASKTPNKKRKKKQKKQRHHKPVTM